MYKRSFVRVLVLISRSSCDGIAASTASTFISNLWNCALLCIFFAFLNPLRFQLTPPSLPSPQVTTIASPISTAPQTAPPSPPASEPASTAPSGAQTPGGPTPEMSGTSTPLIKRGPPPIRSALRSTAPSTPSGFATPAMSSLGESLSIPDESVSGTSTPLIKRGPPPIGSALRSTAPSVVGGSVLPSGAPSGPTSGAPSGAPTPGGFSMPPSGAPSPPNENETGGPSISPPNENETGGPSMPPSGPSSMPPSGPPSPPLSANAGPSVPPTPSDSASISGSISNNTQGGVGSVAAAATISGTQAPPTPTLSTRSLPPSAPYPYSTLSNSAIVPVATLGTEGAGASAVRGGASSDSASVLNDTAASALSPFRRAPPPSRKNATDTNGSSAAVTGGTMSTASETVDGPRREPPPPSRRAVPLLPPPSQRKAAESAVSEASALAAVSAAAALPRSLSDTALSYDRKNSGLTEVAYGMPGPRSSTSYFEDPAVAAPALRTASFSLLSSSRSESPDRATLHSSREQKFAQPPPMPSRQQMEAAQRASLKSSSLPTRPTVTQSPSVAASVVPTAAGNKPVPMTREAFKNLLSRLPPIEAAALEAATRSTPQIFDILSALHIDNSDMTDNNNVSLMNQSQAQSQQQPMVSSIAKAMSAPLMSSSSLPEAPAPITQRPPTSWAPPPSSSSIFSPLSSRSSGPLSGAAIVANLMDGKRKLIDRLPLEGRRAAVRQAQERKSKAESEIANLMRRLEEIPFAALSLEDRVRTSIGRSAADATTKRIREFIDVYRSRHAEMALMHLSEEDAVQLQEDISHMSMHVRALRDDLRITRTLLEKAGIELSGADAELQSNPSVIQMCADQARRQRDEVVGETEVETQRFVTLFGESMRRFCMRARELTTIHTADLDMELAESRSSQADFTQQIDARLEDVRRTSDQRDRVAEEFFTLKDTIERFRDSEGQQEASLQAEVYALEDATKAMRVDAELALAMEMEAVRSAAAIEAEVSFLVNNVMTVFCPT